MSQQIVTHNNEQFAILLTREDHVVIRSMKTKQKYKMPLLGVTVEAKTFDDDTETPVKTRSTRVSTGESKLDKCRVIFAKNPTAEKASIIQRFVDEVNCTPMGANTYYCLLKKQLTK